MEKKNADCTCASRKEYAIHGHNALEKDCETNGHSASLNECVTHGERAMHVACGCGGDEDLSVARIPDEETTYAISDLFKVFGDATRLKILFALEGGEMCGSHLAQYLGLTKAAVSYQLKMLRQHDLVRSRRDGKNVIYRLSDEHVRAIIDCAIEHVME